MGDIIDQAQHYDEVYRQSAISAHFARFVGGHDKVASTVAANCVDCDDEIDVERRKVAPHAIRCIECQTKHERIHGRHS